MTKALMARLDRLLANLGYGSRKDVQALISSGKVMLDGRVLKDVGTKVAVTADLPERMSIRGRPV
ncbi:MAG TPA: S4 domain-containing protein, partial [Caulobacter sp.]|nr:S4 domain-containing protein [Caulobacter sp.]